MKKILPFALILCFALPTLLEAAAPLDKEKTLERVKEKPLAEGEKMTIETTTKYDTVSDTDGIEFKNTVTIHKDYVQQTLAFDDKGDESAVERKMTAHHTLDADGDKNPMPDEGKILEFRKESGQWNLKAYLETPEGKKEINSEEYNLGETLAKFREEHAGNTGLLDTILPEKRARVGDSWKVDFSVYKPWASMKAGGGTLELDKEKSKASCKFEKLDGDMAHLVMDYEITYKDDGKSDDFSSELKVKGQMLWTLDRKTGRSATMSLKAESEGFFSTNGLAKSKFSGTSDFNATVKYEK